MPYQKAVSVWKLMVSKTCSGALSSNSSMMKMRWYGSCWNSVWRTSWSWINTPTTIPSTYMNNVEHNQNHVNQLVKGSHQHLQRRWAFMLSATVEIQSSNENHVQALWSTMVDSEMLGQIFKWKCYYFWKVFITHLGGVMLLLLLSCQCTLLRRLIFVTVLVASPECLTSSAMSLTKASRLW